MSKLKLSKSSLQQQNEQLKLYKKLLPSLDLKRRQLTIEVQKARKELERIKTSLDALEDHIGDEFQMLSSFDINYKGLVQIDHYSQSIENIVGVKLPKIESIEFSVKDYSLINQPPWVDLLVERLKSVIEQHLRVQIATERVEILNIQVRRITQRVNLFDKILIPEAEKNIKRIQIYLGDAERAAVINSKLAKAKQLKQFSSDNEVSS